MGYYTLSILKHIIVPETDNYPAQTRQIFCSPLIALRFRMLPAVNFNDKFQFKAGKISKEGTNR